MSISSINTTGFTSEAIASRPDPTQVKKTSQQNHDAKDATQSITSTPSASQSPTSVLLTPSINTSGQTVGQFVSVKA